MIITDLAIRNRTTVAVLGLIIILMGCYSYMSLPREAFPDIPIPHILVNTLYELFGEQPEDEEWKTRGTVRRDREEDARPDYDIYGKVIDDEPGEDDSRLDR